jgi:hypothetical protein
LRENAAVLLARSVRGSDSSNGEAGLPAVTLRHMTQPAHTSRRALSALALRAAKSWWACR